MASVGVGRWGVSLQVKRAGVREGHPRRKRVQLCLGENWKGFGLVSHLPAGRFTLPAFLTSREKYSNFLPLIKVTKSFIVSELTAVRGYWGKKLQIFKSRYSGHLSEGLVQ